MHRQSLTAYGAPLCETVVDAPRPQGTEVLVRIARCGVCHSDLHMQDGYFCSATASSSTCAPAARCPSRSATRSPARLRAAGPDAKRERRALKVAVYPWIGCGQCAACKVGDENICAAPRHLGITVDGGYATHVLVPHPRYLIDYAPLPASYAGALMCSGLTAYAALKRLADRAARAPLLLIGLGGVGLMGLALARAMYGVAPFVADIDAKKREAALAAGAEAAFDPADPGARKELLKASGGIYAACDFVGSDKSLNFATGVLAKGGKVVVTGLIGGAYSTAVAMFPLKAMTIEGTQTGTLGRSARADRPGARKEYRPAADR